MSVKWALSSDDPRTCLSVDLFPDFPFMDGYQQVLFSYFAIRNIFVGYQQVLFTIILWNYLQYFLCWWCYLDVLHYLLTMTSFIPGSTLLWKSGNPLIFYNAWEIWFLIFLLWDNLIHFLKSFIHLQIQRMGMPVSYSIHLFVQSLIKKTQLI